MSRRVTREHIFKFLYSYNFNQEQDLNTLLNDYFDMDVAPIEDEKEILSITDDRVFFSEIVNGVISNLTAVDKVIEERTTLWTVDRISRVELSILRLAIYEIMYRKDIPDAVSANEAIELAKKFGGNDSGKFVNGIIGKMVEK